MTATSEERSDGRIVDLLAVELAAAIRRRTLSPVEVVRAYLEHAEEANPVYNALVTFCDGALSDAAAAERAIMLGRDVGPLHGIPVTIKDTFDTCAVRTTSGSKLFSDRRPTSDASAVQRLRAAGAIPFAKTNTPEFALWWETDNLVFGRTSNPWDTRRTAGGSSGGEAAAIAARLSPLGIGSDLGGSIRQPAHWCGVVGFKPTHELVPIAGHWPAPLRAFNHVGPLARSVADIDLAMNALAGALWGAIHPHPSRREERERTTLRVAVLSDEAFGPLDPEIARTVAYAASALQAQGAVVEHAEVAELEMHDWHRVTTTLYTDQSTQRYLRDVVGARWTELHPAVRKRLEIAPRSLTELHDAATAAEDLRNGLSRFFRNYDLLLCPCVPVVAPRHGSPIIRIGGSNLEPRAAQRATLPFNVAGLPALALPFRICEGLPVGVQLVGARFADKTVLAGGALLERARGQFPSPHTHL